MTDDLDRRDFLRRAGIGAVALTTAGQLGLDAALGETPRVGKKALRALEHSVRGQVVTPGESGYGKASKVFNTAYAGLRPTAVVKARDAADVQAAMKWADRYDVNLRARSGGHSYAGYSTTNNGVVVDLSGLDSVHTSDGTRRATVGSGAGLALMYAKLAGKGLTVPGGSCPTVGIGGLALGGGMGFASRKLGLTCDSIEAITIVTPDGKLRKIGARKDADLFWACRGGGGGNFGIVTDLTFKTHRVKKAAYYFASWPWGQADQVLEAWQRLTADATPDLCTFMSFLTGNGTPEVHSEGQFFGSESQLRAALKPLTDVSGVQLQVGTSSYGDLMQRWAGCSKESLKQCEKPNRVAFSAASAYVKKPLDSKGRHKLRKAIEQRQHQGATGAILLDGYGGEINKVAPGATAFVHRDQTYCIQYYSEAGSRSKVKGAAKWVRSARDGMNGFTSGEAYQNYIDPTLKGWQKAYYGKNYSRLVHVKTKYDPHDRLSFKQGIKPKR